ncbi:hypothetical protein J2R78_006852 [Bradyrhizobium sp. USDA 4538]|nr:hypothetical protein [Bradyrhizobium sp. USDA 4538]MCP1904451.1 hypothetical protein [Bradyrhizobium sp. USDA 4537]MCP1989893.1 hypothetical protein [Bradyrhizobium sp. USDA 4539]
MLDMKRPHVGGELPGYRRRDFQRSPDGHVWTDNYRTLDLRTLGKYSIAATGKQAENLMVPAALEVAHAP